MPKGDRTGPNGMGSMTGRAAGFCAGNDHPGYVSSGFGNRMGVNCRISRGFRNGFGRGFGYNWNMQQNYTRGSTKEQELTLLKDQVSNYEKNLEIIRNRITELESK